MTNWSGNPQTDDLLLTVGLPVLAVLVLLFMAVGAAILVMQQRRLRMLEGALMQLLKADTEDHPDRLRPDVGDTGEPEPPAQRTADVVPDPNAPPAASRIMERSLEASIPDGTSPTDATPAAGGDIARYGGAGRTATEPWLPDSLLEATGENRGGRILPSCNKSGIQTRSGLRDRLVSARTVLDRLAGEESPLELNRKLAYLQAEVSSMQGADLLDLPATELTEVMQFQGDLKEFIHRQHAAGQSEADPSDFAIAEVRRLEKVVSGIAACVAENLAIGRISAADDARHSDGEAGRRFNHQSGVGHESGRGFETRSASEVDRVEKVIRDIEGFVGHQLQIGRDLLTGELSEISRQRLEATLASADDAFANLVERQHQLANGFLNHDLTMVDGQVDVSPDLVGFCRHRCPESVLLQPQRPALCQFANGEGIYHAEVVTHLDHVRAGCRTLIEQHGEQEQQVRQARTLADEGRFEEAEKLLEGLNPAFTDLNTGELKERIQGWRTKLADLEERFVLLKRLLEAPWERPFAQPWKVIRREAELLAHARDFEDRLEAFRVELNDSGNEESVAEGVQLYHRLADQLNELAGAFTTQSTEAKISTFLHFALIAESLLGWLYAHPESRPVIVWTLGMLGFAFLVERANRWLLSRTTIVFGLETNGRPLEEREFAHVFLNNKRYASGDRIAPGRYQLSLDSNLFEPMTERVRIRYGRHNNIGSIPVRLSRDTYVNSLDMKFVPVGGTTVMFAVWPTRVRDFRVYSQERKLHWKHPRFKQDDLHPAVNVSWEDGRAFCIWLTERERRMGRIGHRDEYRLPTDLEWSAACGLGQESGATPQQRSARIADQYPWGGKWPPSRDSGNLDPSLKSDPYDFTSKVGMFRPNRHGLYDLSGNVWEWCDDLFEGKGKNRTLRGGSWHTASQEMLLSSFRLGDSPGHRVDIIGFRCVLEVRNPSPLFRPPPEIRL